MSQNGVSRSSRIGRGILEVVPMLIAAAFLLVPAAVLIRHGHHHKPRLNQAVQDDYTRAVLVAMQPNSSSIHALEPVPAGPLTVVTWMQQKYVASYQQNSTQQRDVWVTLVPALKTFCQGYMKSHGADPTALTMRLKQRLGLAPDGQYDTFVELKIDPATTHIFRPCGNPSLASESCPVPSLPAAKDAWSDPAGSSLADWEARQKEWLLRNYFSTYTAKTQFPWTVMGYTFDWARDEKDKNHFVQFGENEIVIPAGDPMEFVSAAGTADYCKAPQ